MAGRGNTIYGYRAFLDQAPPPNYIAGLGRGATGFTTQADLGSRLSAWGDSDSDSGPRKKRRRLNDDEGDDDSGDDNEHRRGRFDDADTTEKKAELEDRVSAREEWEAFSAVDAYLASKRKAPAKPPVTATTLADSYSSVKSVFADAKDALKTVSASEWELLPSTSGLGSKLAAATAGTHKYTDAQHARFTPVPDSVLSSIAQSYQTQSAVGDATDVNRARQLLRALVKDHPSNTDAWTSLIRLEETSGRVRVARQVALDACAACPHAEDLWLEAFRLHGDEDKTLYSRALKACPHSASVWIAAAEYERRHTTSLDAVRAVLRRGLEKNPTSTRLWKAAVDAETEPDEARALLNRAVTLVPQSVDLWLALAKLSPYAEARGVLNKARSALPGEPMIWIAACQLEEAAGNRDEMIEKIAGRAYKTLSGVVPFQQWLRIACDAEIGKSVRTAKLLVRQVIAGRFAAGEPDSQDRATVEANLADAASALNRETEVETARAIFQAGCQLVLPGRVSMWNRWIAWEQTLSPVVSHFSEVLEMATVELPSEPDLWLQRIEAMVESGFRQATEGILQDALRFHPSDPELWVKAIQFYSTTDADRSKLDEVISHALAACPRSSAVVLACAFSRPDDSAFAARLLSEATSLQQARFVPAVAPELWVARAELCLRLGDHSTARSLLNECLTARQQYVDAWVILSRAHRLDDNAHPAERIRRARATLERARSTVGQSEVLWLASVRLEWLVAEDSRSAEVVLARALQDVPQSGMLTALWIALAPRNQRRGRCVDALRRLERDPSVVIAAGLLFWDEGRFDKALDWLKKATDNPSSASTVTPGSADGWVCRMALAIYMKNAHAEQSWETPHDIEHAWSSFSRKFRTRRWSGEWWNYVHDRGLQFAAQTLLAAKGQGISRDMIVTWTSGPEGTHLIVT